MCLPICFSKKFSSDYFSLFSRILYLTYINALGNLIILIYFISKNEAHGGYIINQNVTPSLISHLFIYSFMHFSLMPVTMIGMLCDQHFFIKVTAREDLFRYTFPMFLVWCKLIQNAGQRFRSFLKSSTVVPCLSHRCLRNVLNIHCLLNSKLLHYMITTLHGTAGTHGSV